MRHLDGQLLFSASDLLRCQELPHGSVLHLARLQGQAKALRAALREGLVRKVDKFWDRRAQVCRVSITASWVKNTPRKMDFPFSFIRINVAASRARIWLLFKLAQFRAKQIS